MNPTENNNGRASRATYPQRERFFAHRVTRLLFKSCACQDLGHHVVCLVAHVAHTEDAARYQGPVQFWNSQLMETLGFKSPKQLNAARQAAIQHGWLYYARDSDRAVGRYWALIPPHVIEYDDQLIEAPVPIHSPGGKENGPILSASGNEVDNYHSPGGTGSGTGSGKPSYPYPYPFPYPNQEHASPNGDGCSKSKTRHEYSQEFEKWWRLYPPLRRKAKLDCSRKYATAAERVGHGRLLEAVQAYATSDEGQGEYSPEPARWLAKGRYEDDPTTWANTGRLQGGSNSKTVQQQIDQEYPDLCRPKECR